MPDIGLYIDACHLQADDITAGSALLERAGIAGYVFPPRNGWVCIIPEGPWGRPPPDLLDANDGCLLRVVSTGLGDWYAELFSGSQCVASINAAFGIGSVEAAMPNVPTFTASLHLDERISDDLQQVALGDMPPRSPAATKVLATLIEQNGLRHEPFLNSLALARLSDAGKCPDGVLRIVQRKAGTNRPPSSEETWMLPRGMFGTHSKVGTWADRFVRTLVDSNDPKQVVEAEACDEVTPDDLLVEAPRIWLRKRQSHWRPYQIHEALFRAPSNERQPTVVRLK
jgi:hypothetical protein